MSRRNSGYFVSHPVKQMRPEQLEQEIAFTAASNTCDDFYKSVTFGLNQPVKINISLDYHTVHYTKSLLHIQYSNSIFRRTST